MLTITVYGTKYKSGHPLGVRTNSTSQIFLEPTNLYHQTKFKTIVATSIKIIIISITNLI